MCGISGFVGGFEQSLISEMNAAQVHRGPDGHGVWEQPQHEVSLGHVRLAILDLSDTAAQPMVSADNRFVLTYNGEIYNFKELRRRLIGAGHRFRSSGDTEVLLAGLTEWGVNLVEQLNGIFAFALWDNHKRELVLARDPLGVKPIHYAEPAPGTLLFASEIKALLVHPNLTPEPDFIALQQHLAYGHTSGDRTAFRGIRRLPPGSTLRWSGATTSYRIQRYRQLEIGAGHLENRSAATEQLREVLTRATERQLVADVPTGTFLSGGLDSSLLTVIAARQTAPLRCFTTCCPSADNHLDQAAADLPHARRLAKEHQLRLHEIQMTSDVASLLPKLVHHLDEPIADPAVIACYLISKLARDNGTKVLLSGQGADELFGGYPRYRAMQATAWLEHVPLNVRQGLSSLSRRLPGSLAGSAGAAIRRLRRLLSAVHHDPLQRFLNYCTNVPVDEVQNILCSDVRAELGAQTATTECLVQMRSRPGRHMNRFLQRDQSVYLPNHNLLYTDKMSMAVGVEVRVPFLDCEVVRLVNQMPNEWKIRRGQTKAVLRDASRSLVPNSIIDRKKAGFGAPYRTWLRNDLELMWHDLTNETAIRNRGWFNYDALVDARKRSQAGRADLYMLQWAVLTTEIWARQFIDATPASGSQYGSVARSPATAA